MIKIRNLFSNTFFFSIKKKFFCSFLIVLAGSFQLYGQTSIKGKVIDENGEPVIGASVIVESNTNEATLTNIDGSFSVTTRKALPVKLTVKFIGSLTQEITVNDAIKPLSITLKTDDKTLDEVVITAGGIIRARREQGYSTTKLTNAELTAGKSPTLAGGLTAKIPGLQVNAISSGVNPNYRLVLRGNRSITGNNEALIVVDDAIVSGDFLNNINPEDIEELQVLNGASGATLYGSEASNGVLLVRTKKGTKGKPQIRLSHTLSLEQISFNPKLQSRFGQGSTADDQIFEAHENQQYGPAFDGSLRALGYPLENGEQQYTTYSAKSDRENFWDTGVRNQTDVSVSFGSENSTSYISAQYLDASGTTPKDKYSKISLRFNNTQRILPNLNVSYNASYVENNYDITNYTSTIYDLLMNAPANVPVKSYKNWQTDKFASPDGWYNPWYENPYWYIDNGRGISKNTYLTGKIELKYDIKPWLSVLYRGTLSNRYYQNKSYLQRLDYSEYSLSVVKKKNIAGGVSDTHINKYNFNQDFQLALKKSVDDLSFNLTLGFAHNNKTEKTTPHSVDGLTIPGLYNSSNRSTVLGGYAPIYDQRSYGAWGDLVTGYKNYLFLHLTGRKDWTSLLARGNWSYFYPSADVSFIPTDAFSALKESKVLTYAKIRAAISRTGNVNIDPYSLTTPYTSVTGYANGTYFREGNSLVSPNLRAEITTGYEAGTELRFWRELLNFEFTYYRTSTKGQTIYASIPASSGYQNFLLNTGEVTNEGIETSVKFNPIRTKDWNLTLGANYTHNKNLLVSLYPGINRIGVNGSGIIFAEEGYELNQIIVTDYKRDDQGRVIVDPNTGYPSQSSETVHAGNTTPKHRLGVDLSLRWKNFSISALFEYRGGYYYAAHNLGANLDFTGASARSAYYNRERFVFPNSSYEDPNNPGQYIENTNITISDGGSGFWTNSTYNRGVRTNYVYSGDYWKWRELAISYKVPQSFIKKISPYLQDVTISAQGRNLFLWTTKSNEYTDPDYSANDNNAIGVASLAQTPPTRYFGGTLSVTF